MNGHEISEQLVAYWDGALSADEVRKVESHLRDCSTCRETLEDFRRTGELLKRWPGIAPSPDFESRVLAQARATAHGQSPTRRLWNFGLPLRWAMAAAAVLLIAGAAYWVVPHFRNPEGLSAVDQAEMEKKMDLFMNYEVISHMDTLKPMETIPPDDRGESFIINTA